MTGTTTVNTKGTTIKMGDGATPTEVFTEIAEVTDWDGFDETTKSIDVSTLQDDYVEKDGGAPIDSGSVSLDCLYDPESTTFAPVQAAIGTRRNFQIISSNNVKMFSFAAVIVGIKKMAKKGDKLRATIKLDISGAITMSAVDD